LTAYNEGIKRNTGFALTMQQFYGMFVKKFIQARRNLTVAIAQLVLPIVFTIMALAVAESIPSVGDEPALALNLSPFTDNTVAYSDGNTPNAATIGMAGYYKDLASTPAKVDRSKYAEMDDYFKMQQDDLGISSFNRFVFITLLK